MSLLSWLKKNTARDDAWITVHPNAGGKGSPVLLDDEGYIKGGMGGKFTGQRIDLMPRKGGGGRNVSGEPREQMKDEKGLLYSGRYKLKAPQKRDYYQEHLNARHERAVARAEKAEQEANAQWQQWHDMVKDVPFGQPIVNQRMARFAKRAGEKADRAMAAFQRAEELRQKAEVAGTSTAISGRDNLAVEKLQSKLERLERDREATKTVKAALRKANTEEEAVKAINALNVSDGTKEEFKKHLAVLGLRWTKNIDTQNISAEIRRVKERIESIQKAKATPSINKGYSSAKAGAFGYEENTESMRSNFKFDGKPSDEVRSVLKSHGYKWSPKTGTWTRQLTPNSKYAARRVLEELGATAEVTQSADSDFAQDTTPRSMTFDAAPSQRRKDENGFMHVDSSHITKEQVVKYYGREIPGWQELKLDPERLYNVYRPADEIEKAAPTFDGLPLLLQHHLESADEPQKEFRVGSISRPVWNAPYLDCDLHITDGAAIDAIEHGDFKEISAAYLYDPVLERGTFDGDDYEIVMRNLRGNHVALVEKGRAGADVVVADSAPRVLRSFAAWVRRNPLALKDTETTAWDATRNALNKRK